MGRMFLAAALALLLSSGAEARGGGHAHYSYAGGRYAGGHGSSHKGGHYINVLTGNHYRHHK